MPINKCCTVEENIKEYRGDKPHAEELVFCKECGQIWLYHTPFEAEKIRLQENR